VTTIHVLVGQTTLHALASDKPDHNDNSTTRVNDLKLQLVKAHFFLYHKNVLCNSL